MFAAYATTKSNRKKYHVLRDVDGEAVALCSRRIRPAYDAREFDPADIGEAWRMEGREVCARCEREQAKRPESDSKRVSAPDPTVVSLIAAGFDDATHNLARMADIVRGWLADDVDPFGVAGMLDIIASKHVR